MTLADTSTVTMTLADTPMTLTDSDDDTGWHTDDTGQHTDNTGRQWRWHWPTDDDTGRQWRWHWPTVMMTLADTPTVTMTDSDNDTGQHTDSDDDTGYEWTDILSRDWLDECLWINSFTKFVIPGMWRASRNSRYESMFCCNTQSSIIYIYMCVCVCIWSCVANTCPVTFSYRFKIIMFSLIHIFTLKNWKKLFPFFYMKMSQGVYLLYNCIYYTVYGHFNAISFPHT